MKELLLKYAEYNIWANKLIIDTMLTLEGGIIDKEIISSFLSLRKTVYHTWSAESIWLQRLQHAEQPVWPESIYTGSFRTACIKWQQVSAGLMEFVGKQEGDEMLREPLSYRDRQGNLFEQPNYEILQHVLNHSTYHRGQLVTMLRQLGAVKVPQTDYIWYVRRNE